MAEATVFEGAIPPRCQEDGELPVWESHDQAGLSASGARALQELAAAAETTLQPESQAQGLRDAHASLVVLCSALAPHGRMPEADQVVVHGLLVDLVGSPYAARPDGTLFSTGASASMQYRRCLMPRSQAALHCESWGGDLSSGRQTWIVVEGVDG